MIEADRLISAGTTLPEDVADRAIRPKLLEEYVGQPQVRSQMEIFIKADRKSTRLNSSHIQKSRMPSSA